MGKKERQKRKLAAVVMDEGSLENGKADADPGLDERTPSNETHEDGEPHAKKRKRKHNSAA